MDIIGAGKPSNSGGANGGGKSGNVVDGTDQTFVTDVIEPSREIPVLVDFWAEWCGPCRQLGPTLERVVEENKGGVRLVKIDVDRNPGVFGQIARMTGSQSIPTVVAFRNGQPVDIFQGALPESQVRAFINRVKGNGASPGPTVPELLAAAEDACDAGDYAGAADIYAVVLEQEQDNVEAMAGLARCYLKSGDMERAKQIAEMIPEANRAHPSAAALFSTFELASHVAEPDEALELATRVRNSPGDLDARFDYAQLLSGQGKHEDAAEQLLAILEKNVQWKDGAAKEQLLKVFEAAGPKAEVTKEGRRRLSAILFR